MKSQKFPLLLYSIFAVANLVSQLIDSEFLNQLTKPVLMPLLLLLLYKSAKGKTTLPILITAAALIFSWIGDVLLMYQAEQGFFISGIVAFLIAQICYISALTKSTKDKISFDAIKVLPFVVFLIALFKLLLPTAGDLLVPITLYGLVITTMVSVARLRAGNTTRSSYQLAFAGACIFVISDTILAINAFHTELPFAGFLIMSTYCAAQFLLVSGIAQHNDAQQKS